MNNLFILLQDQAQPTQGGSMFSSLFFIILLIVVFWLFFIRPQSKKAKDAKKIMQSLAQWKFILDQLTDKEAKAAMKNVRKAIENQNTIAIKLTKQLYDELNQGEQSLFGLDADVNDYVKASFAHISNVVKQKYGEPYVSIYQISNEE